MTKRPAFRRIAARNRKALVRKIATGALMTVVGLPLLACGGFLLFCLTYTAAHI